MTPGTVIDFVGLQADVAAALANRDELKDCNVLQYRQFLAAAEVQLHTFLFNPRAGRSGTAILVEMPKVRVPKPNLPGPEFQLILPVVCASIPTVALNRTVGSLITAEDALQIVADTLHGLRPRSQLGFQVVADEDYVEPTRTIGDYEIEFGIIAYRLNHFLRIGRTQTQRCDCPVLSVAGGNATLTNGANTPSATIFYTLDGNYPCQFPTPGVVSTQYTGAFPVNSGDIVRWAAYDQSGGGFQASFVGYHQQP